MSTESRPDPSMKSTGDRARDAARPLGLRRSPRAPPPPRARSRSRRRASVSLRGAPGLRRRPRRRARSRRDAVGGGALAGGAPTAGRERSDARRLSLPRATGAASASRAPSQGASGRAFRERDRGDERAPIAPPVARPRRARRPRATAARRMQLRRARDGTCAWTRLCADAARACAPRAGARARPSRRPRRRRRERRLRRCRRGGAPRAPDVRRGRGVRHEAISSWSTRWTSSVRPPAHHASGGVDRAVS